MLPAYLFSIFILQSVADLPEDPFSLDYGALAFEVDESALDTASAARVQTCQTAGWSRTLTPEDCLRAQVIHAHFALAGETGSREAFAQSHVKVQAVIEAVESQYQNHSETAAEIGRLAHSDQNDRYLIMEVADFEGTSLWPDLKARAEGSEADLSARDEARLQHLKSLLPPEGWIINSEYGGQAAQGAWLLVQHADQHPEFQQRVLDRIQPLVDAGEVNASDVALLTDRVRVNTDRPQLYGSQGHCLGSAWAPLPIASPDGIAARRSDMKLQPLKDYASQMSTYCNSERAASESSEKTLDPHVKAEAVNAALERMKEAINAMERISELGAATARWSLWDQALDQAMDQAELTEAEADLARTVARYRYYPETRKAADILETAIETGDWPLISAAHAGVNIFDAAIARRSGRPDLLRAAAQRLKATGQFSASHIAEMIDEANYAEGRPQIYGTIGDCDGIAWNPYEIARPQSLGERRHTLNMSAFETWKAERERDCAAR